MKYAENLIIDLYGGSMVILALELQSLEATCGGTTLSPEGVAYPSYVLAAIVPIGAIRVQLIL